MSTWEKFCVHCGEEKEDVEYAINPYIYDKTGEEFYEYYCLDCLEDMRGDI